MIQNEVVLSEVMKDTADAIREKTGKSDPIAPINFAEEIKSITAGGGEFSPEYYLFDGAKAYNAISGLLGVTDSLQINAKSREFYIGYIGAFGVAMTKYVYKGKLYTDYCLGENTTGISNDSFSIRDVSAVMKIDGEAPLGDAYAVFGLPSDTVTPCTKEEFEALITK
jgi:hypothetical protein